MLIRWKHASIFYIYCGIFLFSSILYKEGLSPTPFKFLNSTCTHPQERREKVLGFASFLQLWRRTTVKSAKSAVSAFPVEKPWEDT